MSSHIAVNSQPVPILYLRYKIGLAYGSCTHTQGDRYTGHFVEADLYYILIQICHA